MSVRGRLLDADGKPVPCQFRPLTRWWGRDNSVQVLLVSFLADPSVGQYRLVYGQEGTPAVPPLRPVTVTELAERVDEYLEKLSEAAGTEAGRKLVRDLENLPFVDRQDAAVLVSDFERTVAEAAQERVEREVVPKVKRAVLFGILASGALSLFIAAASKD